MNCNNHKIQNNINNSSPSDSTRNRWCLGSVVNGQSKCEWNLQSRRSHIPNQREFIWHRKSSCSKLLPTSCCQQEGISVPSWWIPYILHPCWGRFQGELDISATSLKWKPNDDDSMLANKNFSHHHALTWLTRKLLMDTSSPAT